MAPQPPSSATGTLRRVAILINPASGVDTPILAPINRALAKASIDWSPYVLKPDGEADAVAEALQSQPDALWVYGGDGTISRVATVMLKLGATNCPLAVLGGGTANGIAETVGAPDDLERALQRLCGGLWEGKRVDAGMAGERAFLLRATIGAVAGMTNRTTREEKDRLGLLAYALSSLRALKDTAPRRFRIDVDDAAAEHEAISVIVAKSAGTGLRMPLASGVEEQDRSLHAFVVPDVGWVSRALTNAVFGEGLMDGCARYRGRRMTVSADDPVDVHLDGEPIAPTPVTLTVRPAALTLVHYVTSAE